MVPKIPSDPHRSHGIPQLKLSTLALLELEPAMRWVSSSRVDVDFEQDVGGFYRDGEGGKEPSLTSY